MNRLVFTGFCLAASVLLHTSLWAQSRTYVGLEIAAHKDQNSIGDDAGGILSTVPTRGGILGVNIRRVFNPKWFFETGIFYKEYYQSITFGQPYNYPYTIYVFRCLQVPVRVGYKIRLTDKVSLIPEPGISMGFNLGSVSNGFGGSAIINGSGITYSANGTNEQLFFLLLNPSIALERVFFDALILSLFAGRSWGTAETSKLFVDYTIDNSSPYSGTIVNNGNFFYAGVSVKYPIGK